MANFFESRHFGGGLSVKVITSQTPGCVAAVTANMLEALLVLRDVLDHDTFAEYVAAMGANYDREQHCVTAWDEEKLAKYKSTELHRFFSKRQGIYFVLMKEGDDRPLAVACGETLVDKNDQSYFYLKNFNIHPKHKGKGIGTELLAYITNHCMTSLGIINIKVTLGERAIQAGNASFYNKFLLRYGLTGEASVSEGQEEFWWPAKELSSKRQAVSHSPVVAHWVTCRPPADTADPPAPGADCRRVLMFE